MAAPDARSGPASVTVRPVDPHDTDLLDAWLANKALVFTMPQPHTPQLLEFHRRRMAAHRLSGAFDADQLVGTFRSWDWQVSVPGGGSITADAVSSVTVLPTHRRRGALTAMLTRDLADAHRRGVPVAVLVASQAGIYGRFGFGPATETSVWELDLVRARVAPQVPRVGSLRVLTPPQLRPLAPTVFEASRMPGATDRSADWWDLTCRITSRPGESERPRSGVLWRDPDGVPQGYALYEWTEDWSDQRCRTVVTVVDLQAATDAAYAGLWGFLAELDLVEAVRAPDRRVDEPLPWLLTEPRAARRVGSRDMLWARLLDPASALSARRYESPGRCVLEVSDPLGYADGRWELDVDAEGTGTAVPTGAAPQLSLPVDVLSALWLGGGDLFAAAVAGRVSEHVPGALSRCARLLRTTRAPWTGTWF